MNNLMSVQCSFSCPNSALVPARCATTIFLNRTSPTLTSALTATRCDLDTRFSEPPSNCCDIQTKPGSQISWNRLCLTNARCPKITPVCLKIDARRGYGVGLLSLCVLGKLNEGRAGKRLRAARGLAAAPCICLLLPTLLFLRQPLHFHKRFVLTLY